MLVYFLWDIVVQGPGGAETVLLSNVQYYLETGPLAGRSYRASWTTSSASGFYLDKGSANLTPQGVIKSGGIVPRNVPALIFDNALLPESNVREWDHLFGPGYTLEGSVIGKSAVVDVGDPPPALGDFDEFFTGKLSKKPTRDSTAGTVTFYPQPTVDDTNGPLLERTFNGMARAVETGIFSGGVNFFDLPATGPAPDVFASGSFSLQFYGSIGEGFTPPARVSILELQNAALAIVFDFYYDPADNNYKLEVARSGGSDTYALFDATGVLLEDFNFLTVAWDAGSEVLNVWWGVDRVLVDEPILNAPNGVPLTGAVGTKGDTGTALQYSAIRVWSIALNGSQVKAKLGPIDFLTEEGLELALEANVGRGLVLIDDSGKGNHYVNPDPVPGTGSVGWLSRGDGEAPMANKTIPAAFGTVFSAPVQVDDTRFAFGTVGVSVSDVTAVFNIGTPMAKFFENEVGPVSFKHLTMSITASLGWGYDFLVGQRLGITTSSIYDGDYRVTAIIPKGSYTLKQSGNIPSAEVFLEYLDDTIPPWPSSSPSELLVFGIYPITPTDFILDTRKDPYGVPGNEDLTFIRYTVQPVEPTFANVIGNDTILATSPPAGYVPPGALSNVLLQLLGMDYGPKWDGTTLPPVPYSSLPYRVGYYVNSKKPTREVIDDLAGGCQVWVKEDGDGVISFQRLLFPEEHAGPAEVIDKGSVISVKELTERDGRSGRSALSSLVVQYSESVVTMEGSSIPDAIDPDVRAYIASKWRTVTVGAADKATTETPTIDIYVQEKDAAQVIGDRVLRLSQGSVFEVRMTMSAAESMDAFEVGALVNADLPTFSLPNAVGISLGAKPFPLKTSGSEIVVHFWTE